MEKLHESLNYINKINRILKNNTLRFHLENQVLYLVSEGIINNVTVKTMYEVGTYDHSDTLTYEITDARFLKVLKECQNVNLLLNDNLVLITELGSITFEPLKTEKTPLVPYLKALTLDEIHKHDKHFWKDLDLIKTLPKDTFISEPVIFDYQSLAVTQYFTYVRIKKEMPYRFILPLECTKILQEAINQGEITETQVFQDGQERHHFYLKTGNVTLLFENINVGKTSLTNLAWETEDIYGKVNKEKLYKTLKIVDIMTENEYFTLHFNFQEQKIEVTGAVDSEIPFVVEGNNSQETKVVQVSKQFLDILNYIKEDEFIMEIKEKSLHGISNIDFYMSYS